MNMHLHLSAFAISAALTTTPALAQADEDAPAASEDAEPAAAAAADPADEPAAPERPASQETVYVVQGKAFLVAGSFELAPLLVQTMNDVFTSHSGVLVSGLYHLKENVAFEVAAGGFGWWDAGGPRLGGRDSEMTIELIEKEGLTSPEKVKFFQFPWLLGGAAQWSPVYGKVSVQDIVLGQFNIYLSVGAAVLGLQLPTELRVGEVPTYIELPGTLGVLPAMALATSFGGGLRFYFTEWLGVRLEVRDYVMPLAITEGVAFEEAGPSFDVTNLLLGQAGLSFKF